VEGWEVVFRRICAGSGVGDSWVCVVFELWAGNYNNPCTGIVCMIFWTVVLYCVELCVLSGVDGLRLRGGWIDSLLVLRDVVDE